MHKDLGYRKLKVQRFEKIVHVALIKITIVLLEIFNSNCVLGLQFSDRFTSRQSFILTFFFPETYYKIGEGWVRCRHHFLEQIFNASNTLFV